MAFLLLFLCEEVVGFFLHSSECFSILLVRVGRVDELQTLFFSPAVPHREFFLESRYLAVIHITAAVVVIDFLVLSSLASFVMGGS